MPSVIVPSPQFHSPVKSCSLHLFLFLPPNFLSLPSPFQSSSPRQPAQVELGIFISNSYSHFHSQFQPSVKSQSKSTKSQSVGMLSSAARFYTPAASDAVSHRPVLAVPLPAAPLVVVHVVGPAFLSISIRPLHPLDGASFFALRPSLPRRAPSRDAISWDLRPTRCLVVLVASWSS